jgi:choline dehydrogenase-like flavoprotein
MATDRSPEMAGAFTERDLRVLAALAETFVDGSVEGRVSAAAEALEAVADPSQLAQLRLVLRALDSRAVNLVLAGRPTPVTRLSVEAREAVLLGWAGSRIAQRRSAFAAFRKLFTFLGYADPDGTADDPRLTALGYRPDDPPVPAELAPVRPFELPMPDPDGWISLEAEAVVVGSGAGGGVIAADLASAGRSVVVLEAGPFVDEATMPRREVDAFARLYLDRGLLSTWDGSVTLLAGAAVGGGTLVNWMTAIDSPEDVRAEWATEHGLAHVVGDGWRRDVERLETELAVAEATHVPPKDAVILRGARRLDWEAATTRRDAFECGDCGSCGFGCRRGTKRSGIRAHLATAAANGARIVPDARVTHVIIEGGAVTGVEADVGVGSRLRVRATSVVVAAGALRTPAILERSGVEHPALGRHLRIHPVPVVAGWFDERIEMWRGTLQAVRSLEFSASTPDRRGYVIESAPGHPGLLALALPWEGRAAHAALMADTAHLAPLIAITRDGGEGRVRLTRSGHVRLDYRLDELGVATMRHALVSMARLAEAAGAESMVATGTPGAWWHASRGGSFERYLEALGATDFRPNRASVFSAHQLGTARMGADPVTHPCDPWGRVRMDQSGEVTRGLYVGDGSLCPTGLGVNPMITIMAMARHVARTVLA